MKPIIILFILTFVSVYCYSQSLSQNTVPAKVKMKYNALYPEASKPQWVKDSKNYEVNFKLDESRLSILIDSIGNLIETSISTLTLPKQVSEYIDRSYPGQKIAQSQKIIKTEGKIYYKVSINGDELLFTESGLVRK